jgi:glucokinase
MNNSMTIGIDIGGTHISAGLVDLETRKILQKSLFRTRLNTQGPLEDILHTWSEIIKKTASFGSGKLRLGIAMPGPCDYEEGISLMVGQNKFDSLYDLNIKQLLAERLGITKENILMMNDACCSLKGEVYGGAAKGYSNVIGLTLGTGLGSAKYKSSFTYDAELWCLPFFDGLVEDYLSTRWFVQRYKEITGETVGGVKELVALNDTNSEVSGIFDEFGTNLGLFLVKFIEMEDPELVILGGNISNAYGLFSDNLLLVLKEHGISIPVVRAQFGENASIIGAASMWTDRNSVGELV